MIMPIKSTLLLFVLLSGITSLSIEIMAIRLLTPMFGNGVEQTSIIIAVMLLFISLGSYFSPKGNNALSITGKALSVVALYTGLVFNHFFVQLLFNTFKEVGVNVYFSQVIISIVILGPIALILGTIVPVILKLSSTKAINKVIAVSTIGAVSGALLTSLGLKHLFSLSNMIIFNSLILAISCYLIIRTKYLYIVFLSMVSAIWINKFTINSAYDLETGVATYSTLDIDGGKAFIINGNYYSSVIYENNQSSNYNQYIRSALLNNKQKKEILVLGAGGFSLSLGDKFNHFTFVDLDPKLKEIVKKKFNTDPIGQYYAHDARAFINQNSKLFDVVVLDIFPPQGDNIPSHLVTVEFFQKVRDSLNVGGSFAINMIHKGPLTSSLESIKVVNGINKVFGGCYTIPMNNKNIDHPSKYNNTLSICVKDEIPMSYSTDDQY